MRILALDVGSKRIGVAVSDELGWTAQGLDTLICRDAETDVKRIHKLIADYHVTEVVVGMPYNMDGTEGPQAQRVRAFMKRLSAGVDVLVKEWDERLTTVAAERPLLEADMSRAKRRKVIDKLAAVIILQGYLESRHHGELSHS